MGTITHFGRRGTDALAIAIALVFALSSNFAALANVALTRISTDPYINSTSQHATEVEPDTYSFGTTIVSAFQVGRFNDGGASNIGWSTSTDGGASWTSGFLPGITKLASPAGPYDRVSDASVAYDAKHNVWLISSLPLTNTSSSPDGSAVVVSRSTDGGLTWGNPVQVAGGGGLDKNWTTCDNTPASPHYGNCYTEFDNNAAGDLIKMSTSSDGGLTWGTPQNTANNATGLGGQPVVQPNGTVIVPANNANETAIIAFTSTNGGASWGSAVSVARVTDHTVAGSLRTGPLPSAEIDSDGKVYVVWQDCRFRKRCLANDLVLSTSTDGTTWSSPARIPIDATTSAVDHFIPGLAVDHATAGATAHLSLTYYYYTNTSCTVSTCQLNVGSVSSANGGTSWTAGSQLAGPMTLTWLPNTTQGYMVGDYISSSFASGTAHPVIAVAHANNSTVFDQGMYTPTGGVSSAAGSLATTSVNDHPVPNAAADHAAPRAPLTRR